MGMELSELVPHLGQVADEITLIRSMHTGANNHIPSTYALSTGRASSGRAVLGSWLTSALGSETQELPAYVALTDTRGLPLIGGENWSNGKLPSIYQGTIGLVAPRIFNLEPPRHLKGSPQEEQLRLLDRLNREHLQQHPGENDLEARMKSWRPGRAHAGGGAGGVRHLPRIGGHGKKCTASTKRSPATTAPAA